MTSSAPRWDIFLSYAREERAWVEQNLYEPLLKHRTPDGRRPEIFFDVESLDAAVNWLDALADAIRHSRKAVLVYSRRYFAKQMTSWELTKLIERDPTGEQRLINPVLINPDDADQVPFKVSHINYLNLRVPDWFARLVRSLDLRQAAEELRLGFRAQPVCGLVNQTLYPAVEVTLQTAGGAPREEEVVLSTDAPGLQGTLKVRSSNGVAVFRDLFFDRECPRVELLASAVGCEKVRSQPLAIAPPPVVVEPPVAAAHPEKAPEVAPPPEPTLPGGGEAVFFADGTAVAILGEQRLTAFGLDGQRRGEMTFGPLRLLRRAGARMVVADWQGTVHLLRGDGGQDTWKLDDGQGGFCVIGDVALADDAIYAGLWNGKLFRLAAGGRATPLPGNASGIQALAARGNELYVAGLDGLCTVFRGGARVAEHRLEPTVHLFKQGKDGMVALGARALHVIPASGKVLQEPLQVSGVQSFWGESADLLALDERGKGVRINAQCFQTPFHVQAGAVPVSASDDGRYCVFRTPDGAHALLQGDRVVFTQAVGTLAVSPGGDRFAVGDGQGVRLVPSAEFEARVLGGNR